jgi:phage tail-like protein
VSRVLDSRVHRCQWDRIELELASLPEGASVIIHTFATDTPPSDPDQPPAVMPSLWVTHPSIVGERQGRPEDQRPFEPRRQLLVQSREGRYLVLRVEMLGDGFDTPRIRSIRVHYPRESYLSYLPAVFSSDEDSRWFLERFLAIFQSEWDEISSRTEEFAAYLDPESVPEQFLPYLAAWFDLKLEDEWTVEQKRRLLITVAANQARRGTLEGLTSFVQAYLHSIAGLPANATPFPRIVEGFRERERFVLAREGSSVLGSSVPLWGPAFVGRLQLDVFSREGEVRLVSTGDPERDLFHEYAHKFRVFVPSAWVGTREDERMLRRALDTEKPAHTQYDLCLVEPRFRVGVQATLGIDTILGDYPVARLTCQGPDDKQSPPSRAPSGRLGYDTVLGGTPAQGPGLHLTPGARVGIGTSLA